MLTPERASEITFTNIEGHDCAIVALQGITGLSRAKAKELMDTYAGYEAGVGTPRLGIYKVLGMLKAKVEAADPEPGDTVATFALRHEYGRYLIHTSGHVMSLIEGDLYNARGAWHEQV